MKSINGQLLKEMIISGANNLYNNYPAIDALNVFPLPDGDTGTNMNLTMSSGYKKIINLNSDNVTEIAKAFSEGLLWGARGNSGVILSQIFSGFAQGLDKCAVIGVNELAKAAVCGKEIAYKAIMCPVEGTILTIIREASQALDDEKDRFKNVNDAFAFFLKEAQESLKRTPDLLPILKEVGVVDSGGAGLVKILEGFSAALEGKMIEKNEATAVMSEQVMTPIAAAGAKLANEEFGYCTEFILDINSPGKKTFNLKRVISYLENQGNSLAAVQNENLVKVHIHTLYPGVVLTYAQQFGEFATLKIENMQLQHSNLQGGTPVKAEAKEYALIAVSVGEGIEKYFKELRVDKIVSGGQTMNPSTSDFIQAIKEVNAKNVFIFPNNSNIIMAARQAAEVEENCNVHVINTKTIPQGLLAAMLFNPELSVDENIEEMTTGITRIKSGQVAFSIKDTKINDIEIKANQYLGIEEKEIISCDDDAYNTSIKLLEHMIDEEAALLTIIYGEGVSNKEVNKIKEYICAKYPIDVEIYRGDQPVYSYIFGVE